MLQMIKNYKLSNGETINEYLLRRYDGFKNCWEEKGNIVEFSVSIPGLSSPIVFRWVIEGNGFFAANGYAMRLTPELNKKLLDSERRLREIPDNKKAVYYFMKSEWEKLEEEDGKYIPEKHDPIVLKKASEALNIPTEQEAYKIYDEVERAIFGIGLE